MLDMNTNMQTNGHEYKYKLIETKEKIESKPRETKKNLAVLNSYIRHRCMCYLVVDGLTGTGWGAVLTGVPCVGINTPCMDVLLVCVLCVLAPCS